MVGPTQVMEMGSSAWQPGEGSAGVAVLPLLGPLVHCNAASRPRLARVCHTVLNLMCTRMY